MVGTGLGAKRGVLFKNAAALESSARINIVVLDKTGTLTEGKSAVTDLVVDGILREEALGLAAADTTFQVALADHKMLMTHSDGYPIQAHLRRRTHCRLDLG